MTIFKVKKNNLFYLDNSDYQVLYMLYKPAIGSLAINLYLSLYYMSMENGSYEDTLLFLEDSLSIDITKNELGEIIESLTIFKLLKEKSSFVFEIFPPLKAKDFLSSILLDYLKTVVSNKEFEFILKSFHYEEKRDYKNVSLKDINEEIKYYVRKKDKVPFDSLSFVNHVKDSGLKFDINDISFFESLVHLYSLSLDNALTLLFEKSKEDGSYDKKDILNRAHELYLVNKEIETKKNDLLVTDQRNIEYLESTKPEEILKSLSNVSEADKLTINRLRLELGLSNELISLLAAYSISRNDKLLPYNYFKKIVQDWRTKKINNVSEAYSYINDMFIKTKENNSKNIKTSNNQTSEEWFNDFWSKMREGEKK